MSDNCIVTKYELSEREKEIRKAFWNTKGKDQNTQNKHVGSIMNGVVLPPEEEEKMNKMIKDAKVEHQMKQNASGLTSSTNLPLNMIYSQNKILEKNVDVLHETQKSLRDLITLNIQSNTKSKNSSKKETIKEIVQPLINNYEEIKTTLNSLLSKQNEMKEVTLKSKVEDLFNKHSEFKDNSSKVKEALISAENKNKTDTKVINAISELRQSVCNMNKEVAKIESDFNSKFKRIVENIEAKHLNEMVVKESSLQLHGTSGQSKNPPSQSRSQFNMDYSEYRNELYDISHRKDEILNEFLKNKIDIPKAVLPKGGKINFSYNIDDYFSTNETISKQRIPNSTSNGNKTKQFEGSQTYQNSNYNQSYGSNVFLDNLNQGANGRTMKVLDPQSSGLNEKVKQEETKNREELNIHEKMKRFQEKMNNRAQKEDEIKQNATSININHSTKHSTITSPQPSSAKFLKTPKLTQTLPHKLPVIQDEETNEVKYALNEIKGRDEYTQGLRAEIRAIDVTPQDKKNKHFLDDVVLKLCVDKMLTGKNKTSTAKNVPIPCDSNMFLKNHELRELIIRLIVEYIRKLLRMRKRKGNQIDEAAETEEKEKTMRNNMTNSIIRQDERVQSEFVRCVDTLVQKINEMEVKRISEFNNIESVVERITEKIKSGMNININFPSGQQGGVMYQPSTQPVHQNYNIDHHSILIESNQKEEQPKEDENINPFSTRTKMNQVPQEREILLPYKINLDEYEISANTSYITETNRTMKDEMVQCSRRQTNRINESMSHGQIVTETDESIDSPIKNKSHFDLFMLKNFNEQLKGHLIKYEVEPSSNQSDSPKEEQYTSDNGNYSSSGDIPSMKQTIDINNNQQLKEMDLYDSNEYNLFKRQFNNEDSSFKVSQPDENIFKLYKPHNNTNNVLLSFGVGSNRSNQEKNGKLDEMRLSFTQVSNDEINNLINKQNILNDRLKFIGQTNNTISENNSDLDYATLQHLDNQPNNEVKKYKTDESSEI